MKSVIFFLAILSESSLIVLTEQREVNATDKQFNNGTKNNSSNADASNEGFETETVTVETKMGVVKGILKDNIRVFHGVPYAQPPVGDLRWRPPQPRSSWSPSVYDASYPRPECPQHCRSIVCGKEGQMAEDCLYLEISAPVMSNSSSKVPVDVYLHGGGFFSMSATSPIYDSTRFVQRSGIIVVKVEYRLGPLGFLVTNSSDDAATGNYGILDQRLALEWVQDNIEAFGGDPSKVTLHGQSAGSQSIIIHLTSQESSKLFHRAITESNPLSLNYLTAVKATERGKLLAKILGCVLEDGTVDMTCLKDKDAFLVLDTASKVAKKLPSVWDKIQTWAPVIDNIVLYDQPLDALRRHSQRTEDSKPMLMGTTAAEAYNYVRGYLKDPLPPLFYQLFQMVIFDNVNLSEFSRAYPGQSNEDAREDLTTLVTDYVFRCPLRSVANQYFDNDHEDIWMFEWAHTVESDVPKAYSVYTQTPAHGITVPFVFQSFKVFNVSLLESDLRMSNAIIDYLTNFIKFGNPNGPHENDINNNIVSATDGEKEMSTSPTPYWPRSKPNADLFTKLIFEQADIQAHTTNTTNDTGCEFLDEIGYSVRKFNVPKL